MPSGVELYGQIYGLDETTLGRIQTGFDEIRAIEGWENFRIPSYVWDWIGQEERDRMLALITTSLWDYRGGVDLPADVPKTAHFVFLYVLFVWAEWWYDMPDEDKPEASVLLAGMQTDWGFADWAFTDGSYGDNFTVVKDLSVDGYDELEGFIHHPYHDGPDYVTDAWHLTAWSFYLYHEPSEEISYINVETGTWYAPSTSIYYFADIDGGAYYAYEDTYPDYVQTLLGDYDDRGVEAVWPDGDQPILINGEHEVISGRATFKNFGLMDGSIETTAYLEVGAAVQVARGSTIYFTGIVTGVKASLVDGVNTVSVSDPVTAGGGKAVFTSGDAIDAMQEAIEAHGGTFETGMTTTETVVYTGDPLDAWQFFRAACYSVGGVLQYGRDGVYRLIAAGTGHGLTDADIVGDDGPTVEERPGEYANRVSVSIDEEWQEDALENVTETFTASGVSVEIVRLGERKISETVDYSDGSVETTYTYDENGYMVLKETEEEGSGINAKKQTSSIAFTNIDNGGNTYDVAETIQVWEYWEIWDYDSGTGWTDNSRWVPTSSVSRDWQVDLAGISKIVEEVQGREPLYTQGLGPDLDSLVPQKQWIGSVISNPEAGPLEGFTTVRQYNYVNQGYAQGLGEIPIPKVGWSLISPGMGSYENKSYTPPKLEVYAAEDTNEIHIIAHAEDPDSITALGAHEYETTAVALDTETGMQAFALGVLYEKSRIRQAGISIPLTGVLPHNSVTWRGLAWNVESVSVDLDGANEDLSLATQSTLLKLSGALNREPVTWVDDVKNAINKRVSQYENVSRGRVLSQVGFRRYMVQAEGKVTPVEAKALTDDPALVGGSVILVRPTGKNQPWTLLSLSKEQGILMPSLVQENITPDADGAPDIGKFEADQYETEINEERTLTWTFDTVDFSNIGVIFDPGDGTDSFDIPGETFPDPGKGTEAEPATCVWIFRTVGVLTPTITPFRGSGEGRVLGDPVELAVPGGEE